MKWVNLPDVVGIRAPKPTFIISGERDSIFPQHGVQQAYQELRTIYHAAQKPEALGIDVWENHGHEFTGRKAYPWLDAQFGFGA